MAGVSCRCCEEGGGEMKPPGNDPVSLPEACPAKRSRGFALPEAEPAELRSAISLIEEAVSGRGKTVFGVGVSEPDDESNPS